MASNLNIDAELLEAWAEAQKSGSPTRFLLCKIENEDIKLTQHVERQRAAMADFDCLLKPMLSETEPALVIFLVKEGNGYWWRGRLMLQPLETKCYMLLVAKR